MPVQGGYNLCMNQQIPMGGDEPCYTIVARQINNPGADWSKSGSPNCSSRSISPNEKSITCEQSWTRQVYNPHSGTYSTVTTATYSSGVMIIRNPDIEYTCPNPNYKSGPQDLNGSKVCYRTNGLDPDCPEPNPATDEFSHSIDKSPRCFTNADDSVCQYDYSADMKGYMISAAYAKKEWFPCGPATGTTQKPITASVLDPLNLDPLPDGLYGTQSLPTATEGDNSDAGLDIDALNQVNDNLTSLIENNAKFDVAQFKHQNDSTEILKHLVAQDMVATDVARNTNQLLMSSTHNQTVQAEAAAETNDILGLMLNSSEQSRISTISSIDSLTSAVTGDGGTGDTPCEGPDCAPCEGPDCAPCEGPDCTPCTGIECLDISTEQTGKQGGLATLFTPEDVLAVQTQIEEQLVTNKNELDTISTELESMFTIDPSLAGGYEARTIEIKGERIDISLRRYSEFFQMLSTPIMLAASITALFILMRER